MVIAFKILLIILVAAPVVVFASYLWLQIRKYVSRKNQQDPFYEPAGSNKRRRR